MRILHLEYSQYSPQAIGQLKRQFELDVFDCDSQEQLYSKLRARKYQIIFTRLGLMIDETVMSLQPDLKFIVTPTTGLNHIDVKAAGKRQIKILSLKDEAEFLSTIKSTAEHTWGLLLSLVRNLPAAIDHVRRGGWDRKPFLSDELDGKTLGVIGFGRLGKIISKYAGVFGMRVLVHDVNPKAADGFTEILPVSLTELLTQSDIVILLISWSEENENFMNAARFGQMRPGSYFINTSRGELVDENALLAALQTRKIKGAALDVLRGDSAWTTDVSPSNSLLDYMRSNGNLLITPHMGGFGKESIARTRSFVVSKFLNQISLHAR